jgi:hypothetical protein
MAGDGESIERYSFCSFTPNDAKTVIVYWNDAASKDSIVTHLNSSGYGSYYDVISMSEYAGSLLAWRTAFVLFGTGVTWNDAIRDSLKSFLDNSISAEQKTLAIFGNDIAYANDPIANASATAADTTFLRQYLRAQFIGDNWITSIPGAAATVKGVSSFAL